MPGPLRVAFVTGATPDKWASRFRERERGGIELIPVDEEHQEVGIRDGSADMALVRLPIDRDGLHCIPLYEETVVAVIGVDHVATVVEELSSDDLGEEQLLLPHRSGWTPAADQRSWPAMTVPEAIEVAASGTGIVLLPQSVARLHHRRDVTHRPVTDLEPTTVGLAWRIDHDDPRLETFVGVVRGRTARSSRGRS